MNVNEWGVAFVFSTGFVMSGFTALSLQFTKPDGTTLVRTNTSSPNAVTCPAVQRITPIGTLPASTYVLYTFANGDVSEPGTWTARLSYTDASQFLISAPATFIINP